MSTKKALVAGGGFLALAGALLALAACVPEGETRAKSSPAERSPSRAQPSRAASGAALEVRVMSFNVAWEGLEKDPPWERRRDLAAAILRDENPDSVGLQEPSPRQVTDLVNALPQLESFTFDRTTQPVLYRSDRFRLEEAGGFLLFPGTALPGSRRTCTWVRLVEISTGRAYYHYNVHLDHRLAGSRQASARHLSQRIAVRSPPDPFVVTGDFNARENSPTLRFLRGEIRLDGFENPLPLVDTFRVRWPEAEEVGTTRSWKGKRGRHKIDHVLVEPATGVLAARIIDSKPIGGLYPSDHLPVVARLRWMPPSGP